MTLPHMVTSLYVLTSVYIAIVTVTFVVDLVNCCQFPLFVQTNETIPARDWRTRIQEHYTRFNMSVSFIGDQMKMWSNETIITRVCLEQFTEGVRELLLVSHTELVLITQRDRLSGTATGNHAYL